MSDSSPLRTAARMEMTLFQAGILHNRLKAAYEKAKLARQEAYMAYNKACDAVGDCHMALAEFEGHLLAAEETIGIHSTKYVTIEPATDCPNHCDDGKIWNNADPTSGQWSECEHCSQGAA